MSRNQRLTLVVAVVVVAVVAFVIVSPGGDDGGNSGATPAATTTERGVATTARPPAPAVERIAIKGTEVAGGVRSIKVKQGDQVRIVVASDAPDTLHVHGYDIEHEAKPGSPARFSFEAKLEGVFELESHTWEDAGLEAAVAKLVVEPS